MNHLADFNISQLRHRQQSVNTNECNVVINNIERSSTLGAAEGGITSPGSGGLSREGVGFVPPYNPISDPDIPTGYAQAGGIVTQVDPWDAFLYQMIAQTLSHVLKTNNRLFVANAIDMSGKIIVSIVDLVTIIGITCKVPAEHVTIEYVRHEVACCTGRFNPITDVTSIKVNGLSYEIAYNEKYNVLTNVYGLSLRKVYVGIDISY